MSENEYFEGFSEEQQKEYEEEARQRWGADSVNESVKHWNSYSPEKQKQILAEGGEITRGIVANMSKGPGSPEVQAGIAAWHRNMGYFYECSYEQALRLGHLYVDDPRFAATYRRFHPDLPEFLLAAIEIYCKDKV